MLSELLQRLPDLEVSGKPERLPLELHPRIKRRPARFTPVGLTGKRGIARFSPARAGALA